MSLRLFSLRIFCLILFGIFGSPSGVDLVLPKYELRFNSSLFSRSFLFISAVCPDPDPIILKLVFVCFPPAQSKLFLFCHTFFVFGSVVLVVQQV